MATQIYLGNPPENIKKWIEENTIKPVVDMLTVPLHFTAESNDAAVALHNANESQDFCYFVYSDDEMKTWNDYNIGTAITLNNCQNKTVYFKAKYGNNEENPNLNGLCNYATVGMDDEKYGRYIFGISGRVKANGNIQFLLENTGTTLDAPPYAFYSLFEECYGLIQAPLLPATRIGGYAYSFMFHKCDISTFNLPHNVYRLDVDYTNPDGDNNNINHVSGMFSGCYKLKNITLPENIAEIYPTFLLYSFNPVFTVQNKTFDEMVELIQNYEILGCEWYNENDEIVTQVEITCSDKTMIATFDENEYTWTITEK